MDIVDYYSFQTPWTLFQVDLVPARKRFVELCLQQSRWLNWIAARSYSGNDNYHYICNFNLFHAFIGYLLIRVGHLLRCVGSDIVMPVGIAPWSSEMKNTTENELIRKMVGRDVLIDKKCVQNQFQNTILKVDNLNLIHLPKHSAPRVFSPAAE